MVRKAFGRFRFQVQGRGRFPFDMLQYDACYPATRDDAQRLASVDVPRLAPGFVKVELISSREPTAGRWGRYGWRVLKCEGIG